MKRVNGAWALALGLVGAGCIVDPGDIGELPGDSGTTTDGGSGSDGASGQVDTDAGDSSGSGGPAPSACGPDGPSCIEDQDGDCVALEDDNAPGVYNPDQSDHDGDGIADPIDLCPSVPSVVADTDHDGLGNECDPCRRAASSYNEESALPTGYMLVRNIPSVADADGDGIGDACDNCVVTPNCEGYGPGNEWRPGDPIADTDPSLCQADADSNMVGDACEGLELPGAAGPVGLGPADDFDQDGLVNVIDACPRSPLADAIACTSDDDCPTGRACELGPGRCDHQDIDADGVGDACDSCSVVENPLQIGGLPELDDTDGDFLGDACDGGCSTVTSPARVGVYPVAVEGWCCTVQYRGDGELFDPDGRTLLRECDETMGLDCRQIPLTVGALPGMLDLPPGCDAALAEAGLTVETHVPLTPADVGGLEGLWEHSCRLPPLDQDFDGLHDSCDLCPLSFDPSNEPYIDPSGQLWPDDGRYCNGEYSIDNVCAG